MDQGTGEAEGRHRASASPRPYEGSRLPVLLAAFVAAYAVLDGVVTFFAGTPGLPYGAVLLVLAALAGGMFFASLVERRPAAQRCYLVLSILPILTLTRFAFSGNPIVLLDPLLVYLLLALALVALRSAAGSEPEVPALGRRGILRSLGLGLSLAAAITLLGFVLPLGGGPASEPPWLLALVLAPAALLDEFWFRGILQGSIARVTSAPSGWIATVVLFAAYGEPFGTATALLFRVGLGLTFGALAMRRENVPVTLVARTALTVGLLALNPGLAATSLLV